jgi:hypothetical protein
MFNKNIYYIANINKVTNLVINTLNNVVSKKTNNIIIFVSYIYLFYKYINSIYIEKYNIQKTYEFIISYFIIIFLVYNLQLFLNFNNNLKNNSNYKKFYSLLTGLIYIIFHIIYNKLFYSIVEGSSNRNDELYNDSINQSASAQQDSDSTMKNAAENMKGSKQDSNTGNEAINNQDGNGQAKQETQAQIDDFNDGSGNNLQDESQAFFNTMNKQLIL